MNQSIRHFKERFDAKRPFAFLRPYTIQGKQYKPGDLVPEGLLEARRAKIWWDARAIRHATAAELAAQTPVPAPAPAGDPAPAPAGETATTVETATTTVTVSTVETVTEEAPESFLGDGTEAPKPKRRPLGKKPQ